MSSNNWVLPVKAAVPPAAIDSVAAEKVTFNNRLLTLSRLLQRYRQTDQKPIYTQ
jgi:hypothetical protein